MDNRYIVVLIFFLTANLSLSQDIPNSQDNIAVPNLKYIWSITGIENDQITMALDQEGNNLFGQAKYEPENGEPWNGIVAGFVSGNRVHLAVAALEGNKQASILMDGTFVDEAISGNFFQTIESDISSRGAFNAIGINPELSSYAPAKIKELKPEMPVPKINKSNITAPSDTIQPKSTYHDVHQDADRILTGVGDISQIPIGMSAGGGNGMP